MAKSYFTEAELEKILVTLSGSAQPAPQWLIEVLKDVPNLISVFPPAEDAERYVVEYVYPH